MKIAAISDIHSNVYALQAVIGDIKKRGVDVVVNLGDILYGPIAPKATFDLLMEYDFVTVRGNQDRQIYEATAPEIDSNPTMQFILKELDSDPLEWMKALPSNCQLTDDVYLCHGTPNDNLIYLLENVESGLATLRSDHEIIAMLEGQTSNVILCGHTHTPRSIGVSSGQLIINPGSVGLPAYTDDEPCVHSMQNFSYHASYTVIDGSDNNWTVQHVKVDYDYTKAANDAEKRNRKDWVHFLTTGRGL